VTKNLDFVVVGAGVFGAWTAHHLHARGASVVLIDAYGPASGRASSGGESRIIRLGYGPDELYTRWSARALHRWKEFGARVDQKLFHPTGLLWLSNDDEPSTRGLVSVLSKCGIAYDKLSASELELRYPQLVFRDASWGVLEPESGVLMARRSVQVLVDDAVSNGVEFIRAFALPPKCKGSRLETIQTSDGTSISAGTFIFACGPWLPKVFPELLAGRIQPTRQEVFFFGTPAGDSDFHSRMPAWLHANHPHRPYAMPSIESRGFKIAIDRHGPDFDPDSGCRLVSESSVAEVRGYLKEHVPALHQAPVVETRVCQYENTWNGDFLIDRHPQLEDVWIVGGGSGHGFKHGPVVGEYVTARIFDNASAEPRFSFASKQKIRLRAVF
jgi:sarcosine oxidase